MHLIVYLLSYSLCVRSKHLPVYGTLFSGTFDLSSFLTLIVHRVCFWSFDGTSQNRNMTA
jgi:hypothetical protein